MVDPGASGEAKRLGAIQDKRNCRIRILGNGSHRSVGTFGWLGIGNMGTAGGFAGFSSGISKARSDRGIKISLPFGEIVHRPAEIGIVISEVRAGSVGIGRARTASVPRAKLGVGWDRM